VQYYDMAGMRLKRYAVRTARQGDDTVFEPHLIEFNADAVRT